jgi:uncharacterized protein
VALWIVTYKHPNFEGWQQHLRDHIVYLQELLASGVLRASGPINHVPDREALLIISAESREALMEIIEKDPFSIENLVDDMTVREWDPLFGAFNAESSMPGRFPG